MTIKYSYLAAFCLFGAACSESPASETATAAAPTASAAAENRTEARATYRLLEITKDDNASKLNANVLLSRKVDEAQLKELGMQIRDSIAGYQRTYLFFYLDGMKVGSGAWATAQYAPDEEIRVLGATQAEEDSSKSKLRVDGQLIGKWYDEQRSSSGLALYERDGKCFLKRVYKGGTPSTTRFVRTGNTFKPKEETGLGEYFVLQEDGTLGFVNDEGTVFGQAYPLN